MTKSKDLDVDSVVFELRMHRMLMVQTQSQFQFCYKAVLDGIRMMLKEESVAKQATLPRVSLRLRLPLCCPGLAR